MRVPWLEPGILMKMLDAGAYGVICPMVNTVAEAELFVRSTTYPPRGERSFGPIRALLYGGADYPQHADKTIVRFAMIETRKALDNLKEILRVDGLDAVYVGPADLSNALGCTPKFDQDEKPVVDAIDHIVGETLGRGQDRRHPQRNDRLRQEDDRERLPLRHDRIGRPADGGRR